MGGVAVVAVGGGAGLANKLAQPFLVPSGMTLLLGASLASSFQASVDSTVVDSTSAAFSGFSAAGMAVVVVSVVDVIGAATAGFSDRLPLVWAPARPPRPPRPRSPRARPRPSNPPRPRPARTGAGAASVGVFCISLGLGRLRSVVFFFTSPH